MKLTLRRSELHLLDLRTRMPFRYGIATMTEMPLAFVRLHALIDGQECHGTSSDLLPPKWFTKVPEKPPAEEVDEMVTVIRNALRLATDLSATSVFDAWRQLYTAQDAWSQDQSIPPLLAHFGTSLVERALIEAACRAAHQPFHTQLQQAGFGIDLGQLHPSLQKTTPSLLLPSPPLPNVIARHTIGLADPLTDAEISEKLDDGLPQSLSACIRAYGLTHFKLKLNGDPNHDLQRLSAAARIIQAEASHNFAFTLDGNEQFPSIEAFRDFWDALAGQVELKEFLRHMLFVEQPLHRREALQPDVKSAFDAWPDHPPVIIDESDGALDSAALALELGYNGTSHKNCKGVFKGIANRCLIAQLQSLQPDRRWIMSGEDLCNIGPVALPQDLAVMAALGIESVERNGHHYNAGLSQLPKSVQRLVLTYHSDLYRTSDQGWPTLAIQNGRINLGSVNRAPFGTGFSLPLPLSGAP